MSSWIHVDHKVMAIGTLGVTSAVAIYATFKWRQELNKHQNKNVYESRKSMNEYLVFHYGSQTELLRYDSGPKDSLDFPRRCAELCASHYTHRDSVPSRAFDIGCAVGRSTFELARTFTEVIGLDYSEAFVDKCVQLRKSGSAPYCVTDEGDLVTNLVAKVPADVDRERASFMQGDACNLPTNLGQFGCVLAANLIDRLHHPLAFLDRLPGLVAPGGVLVITSPYTWLQEFTDKKFWLGGYRDKEGKAVRTLDTLKQKLAPAFDFVTAVDMPFFIRETARKNQWSVAQASVWKRKA